MNFVHCQMPEMCDLDCSIVLIMFVLSVAASGAKHHRTVFKAALFHRA